MHFLQTILHLFAIVCLIVTWVVPARHALIWGAAIAFLGIFMLALDGWSWSLLFPFGFAALAFVMSRHEKRLMTLAELNENDKSRGS